MIYLNNNTIHLQGKSTSYIMTVGEHNDLLHYYYGKKLADREYKAIAMKDENQCAFLPEGYTLENYRQEYPSYGYSDLKSPAYDVFNSDGNNISMLKVTDIKIKDGVYNPCGLPHILQKDNTAQTSYITLCDEVINLEVTLIYTVFDEYDVIIRSAEFKNLSDKPIRIDRAYSSCLELYTEKRDVIYFPGSWARERYMERAEIRHGEKIDISNARGGSGHNMNPFAIVCNENANENYGEAIGFSLIYSGNHSTYIESDADLNLRIMQGINPQDFSYTLNPNENLETPQSVICYSLNGIGGVSRELNRLYRNNLCRSEWANKDRPILINNWEATYFDFTEDKLVSLAKTAKETGIELFVLDDGWFGSRNDDFQGLGDWFVNKSKLPSGIDGLSQKINDVGLKFGIWIEPEMVNPNSDLFRAHPDWVIHVPNRQPTLSRNQLILDLTRKEVRDYIVKSISNILSQGVSYVKWDMNRPMTDMPRPGYNYEYTLGYYDILDRLTKAFPHILFEGCASGGGRFDAGALHYVPQIWTSDNSDAVARLKIQYSTSIGYPLSSISAHVTASPNHQNGRITPLKTRADVAYAGMFGYELDITQMSNEDIEEIKKQISFYKSIRTLIRTADFYRLQSPYETNYCTWQAVSPDKNEAFVMSCKIETVRDKENNYIKLYGLDSSATYTDTLTGKTYYGDELLNRGIMFEYELKDFSTVIMHLVKN
jgi:alpha-galactosidase